MTARPCIGCDRVIHGEPFQMWTKADVGPYHEVCFNLAHPGEQSQDKTGIFCREYTDTHPDHMAVHCEWDIPAYADGIGYGEIQRTHDRAALKYQEITGNKPPTHTWLRGAWTPEVLTLGFVVRKERGWVLVDPTGTVEGWVAWNAKTRATVEQAHKRLTPLKRNRQREIRGGWTIRREEPGDLDALLQNAMEAADENV